jgi:hypothetical protein
MKRTCNEHLQRTCTKHKEIHLWCIRSVREDLMILYGCSFSCFVHFLGNFSLYVNPMFLVCFMIKHLICALWIGNYNVQLFVVVLDITSIAQTSHLPNGFSITCPGRNPSYHNCRCLFKIPSIRPWLQAEWHSPWSPKTSPFVSRLIVYLWIIALAQWLVIRFTHQTNRLYVGRVSCTQWGY